LETNLRFLVVGATIGFVMVIGFSTQMDIKMIVMNLAFTLEHDAGQKALVSAHTSSWNV